MKLCCTTALLVVLTGCGTASQAVRLDTGQSSIIVFTPHSGAGPVTLDDDESEKTRELC